MKTLGQSIKYHWQGAVVYATTYWAWSTAIVVKSKTKRFYKFKKVSEYPANGKYRGTILPRHKIVRLDGARINKNYTLKEINKIVRDNHKEWSNQS